MNKAVLFDLDGTLLNTIDDLWQSTNYALRRHGYPERSREEVLSFVGNGVAKLIERATPSACSQEQVEHTLYTFKTHYLRHSMDRTRPYDGIIPLLTALRRQQWRIGVVSNKLHEAVEQLCAHYFPHLIDVCAGMSVQHRAKPAPDMVLAALQQLSVDSSSAVYVGDSDVDIATARAAGLPCVSVSWGFRARAFLLNKGAEVVVDTPEQLQERLSQMLSV